VIFTEIVHRPGKSTDATSKHQRRSRIFHLSRRPIASETPKTTTEHLHDLSTASLLTLLQKCKYPPEKIPYFLALWEYIVPRLAPVEYASKLARDGTPYDMQWNLVSGPNSTSESIVRVSFDVAQQPRDLINALCSLSYLSPEDANTTLLDSALATLSSIDYPEDSAHAPWFASGIDMLRSGKLLYKIYLRPATASARTLSHTRAGAIVSTWDKTLFGGGLERAYSVIDKYNAGLEDEHQQKVHMLGWDCVSVKESRVKVYTYHSHTSLSALKDMWTQRGQLSSPEIDIGLRCIEELWYLLFAPEDVNGAATGEGLENEEKERLSRLGKAQSICLGLEIKQGAAVPTPKMYLQPARFGTKSDQEIAETLQGWFRTRGFGEICEGYGEDFKEIL
jgi:DMATS type aromatic prenyltransferase